MFWIRIILGVGAVFLSAGFIAFFAIKKMFFWENQDSDHSFFTSEKSEILQSKHRENARIIRVNYISSFM